MFVDVIFGCGLKCCIQTFSYDGVFFLWVDDWQIQTPRGQGAGEGEGREGYLLPPILYCLQSDRA